MAIIIMIMLILVLCVLCVWEELLLPIIFLLVLLLIYFLIGYLPAEANSIVPVDLDSIDVDGDNNDNGNNGNIVIGPVEVLWGFICRIIIVGCYANGIDILDLKGKYGIK